MNYSKAGCSQSKKKLQMNKDLGSLNFASVRSLTPVTVHMRFLLPRGNLKRQVTRCTTPGSPPCRGNFAPCERNAKVATGQV